MRVLLIDPKVDLPIDVRSSPALGLAYLAAMSERRGDQVRVLDMQAEDIPLRQVVDEQQPDVIGITATTIEAIAVITAAVIVAVAPGCCLNQLSLNPFESPAFGTPTSVVSGCASNFFTSARRSSTV